MAVVVFSLMNVALALGARSATETALDRDSISGRRQLLLYGLALLFTVLSTELGLLQRILGTTSLTGGQWLLCIGLAAGLLLVGELIKLVLRLPRLHRPRQPLTAGPDHRAQNPRLRQDFRGPVLGNPDANDDWREWSGVEWRGQ